MIFLRKYVEGSELLKWNLELKIIDKRVKQVSCVEWKLAIIYECIFYGVFTLLRIHVFVVSSTLHVCWL